MATTTNTNVIKDVTLEIDEFARNKIVSGATAEAQQLYILLYSKPGDFEDDFDKGIDISKYRYGLTDQDAAEIQIKIDSQVSKYCQFQLTSVKLTYTNGILGIQLATSTSSDVIVFKTDETSSTQMELLKS